VVTGHSTKSIAAYVTKSLQVKNDNNTETSIPGNIHTNYDLGIQTMTTYIWCKECHQLRSKELLHEECEPNLRTKKAIEDARNGRIYNDMSTLSDDLDIEELD
jgi:hypothetical protein